MLNYIFSFTLRLSTFGLWGRGAKCPGGVALDHNIVSIKTGIELEEILGC